MDGGREEDRKAISPFQLFRRFSLQVGENRGPNNDEIWSKQVSVVTCRKTTEDREGTNEDKQAAEDVFSAFRQTGGSVWTSGCRSTSRQLRRFKAPCLPVITEM
ncbi:hypothetical protein EXN66_Car021244 [Channa argus]|uniref:Uncharacterized protein n=1 Tax=Channa argus TaxID=215402 RepID=A0A6G1QTD0_CHAAH|nr:hypothetical protein EXN66_Car021244 [Channa argus]